MANQTPPESVDALDISALGKPDIKTFSAWELKPQNSCNLAGIATLKNLIKNAVNLKAAKIKSMRTATAYQRIGVTSKLLTHLINEAKLAGISSLYLETGSMDTYAAARSLYEKFGFTSCAPYADYVDDPNRVLMQLYLV